MSRFTHNFWVKNVAIYASFFGKSLCFQKFAFGKGLAFWCNIFTPALSSTWYSLVIPLLFEEVFAQYLKTCLQICVHHFYRHVFTLFTVIFTKWHVFKMFRYLFTPCLLFTIMFIACMKICEGIFTQFWEMCLWSVWRHVYTHVYSMLVHMLTQCGVSKNIFSFFWRHAENSVWKYLQIMFEDIFALLVMIFWRLC